MPGFAVVDHNAVSGMVVDGAFGQSARGGFGHINAVGGDVQRRVIGVIVALEGACVLAALGPGAQLPFHGPAAGERAAVRAAEAAHVHVAKVAGGHFPLGHSFRHPLGPLAGGAAKAARVHALAGRLSVSGGGPSALFR